MRFAIVLACLLVAACGPFPTVEGYKQIVSSWDDSKADDLVRSWGPPSKSYTFDDGSKVLVYVETRTQTTGGRTYEEPQTVYLPGTFKTATVYVQRTTPVYEHTLRCSTTFTVNPQGTIVHWKFKGNDCTAYEKEKTDAVPIPTPEPVNTAATSHMARGRSHLDREEYSQAIEAYSDAIKISLDNAQAYMWRGYAFLKTEKPEKALRDLDEAILIDPALSYAYYARGTVYQIQGKNTWARRDLSEAIRLDPTLSGAYFTRGENYYSRARYDLALKDYDLAIRHNRKLADAYNGRCWVYGRMRRPRRALLDCDEALRLQPDHADTLVGLAFAHWQLGDSDRAREYLEQARRLDPDTKPWRD